MPVARPARGKRADNRLQPLERPLADAERGKVRQCACQIVDVVA
jgi:hypothetical protein